MEKYGIPQKFLPGKAYINGSWVTGKEGKTFEVRNPATGELLAEVPDLGAADAEEAIGVAYETFQTWKETTAKERAKILRTWGELLLANQEHLAKLLTLENGKPLNEAKGEIGFSASFFQWYSEEARRTYGDVVPTHNKKLRLVFVRQPVGVAGLITPWNFPAGMIARKAAAALAAGCTTVLKPAEDTPLSALAMAKLGEEAGVPPGVFNILPCSRANAPAIGKTFCESPLVAKISFTGSTATGKVLLQQAASTVKKVSMELGGNAPFIVFNSANVDEAVRGAMTCKYRGSGQTCVCANRILIQEGVYDEFCDKFAAEAKKLVVGDGMKEGVTQGPLINERGFEKVKRHVEDALQNGGKVLVGGKPHSLGRTFFEPTVISEVTNKAVVFEEETFGPLAALVKFKTEEEAVAIANNSRHGLAGYFYSQDISQAWRVAEKLEVGMVGINESLISLDSIAFGGVKESGLGREGSKYGLDDYMEIKYICFGGI